MVYVHEEFDQLAWSENASYIYPGDLWMAIFTGIGAKRPIFRCLQGPFNVMTYPVIKHGLLETLETPWA